MAFHVWQVNSPVIPQRDPFIRPDRAPHRRQHRLARCTNPKTSIVTRSCIFRSHPRRPANTAQPPPAQKIHSNIPVVELPSQKSTPDIPTHRPASPCSAPLPQKIPCRDILPEIDRFHMDKMVYNVYGVHNTSIYMNSQKITRHATRNPLPPPPHPLSQPTCARYFKLCICSAGMLVLISSFGSLGMSSCLRRRPVRLSPMPF